MSARHPAIMMASRFAFIFSRRRELERHVREMRTLLLSMMLIAPGAVLAQQPPNTTAPTAQQVPDPKAKITACLSEDAGAFLANHVIGCYEQELRRQDALLNGAYQRLVKKFPSIKVKLVDGQRAWIAYRDNWCSYEGLIDQPPSAAASRAICLSELTEAQARRLTELADADAEALTEAPSNAVPPRAPVTSNSPSSADPVPPASSNREGKSSADLSELCRGYSESYRANTMLDNTTGRGRMTPEQRARFSQQVNLCPDWQKKQAEDDAKNTKAELREMMGNMSECSAQKTQIDAALNSALEMPAVKSEVNMAMMLLAAGQPKMYCEKMQNAIRPYLDIRDILARCGSPRSIAMSTVLNQSFGGIEREARQNGCRN